MTDNQLLHSSSVIRHLSSADVTSTHRIAASLARECRRGDCILLHGDLGAGKTTFARGFIETLSPGCGEVLSPTFTLVQTYLAASGDSIWHFDLYRIKHHKEIEEIGLDEALNTGITLIEWPEIIKTIGVQSRLPEQALAITIEIVGNERQFTFAGIAELWQGRLDKLYDAI